jgi:branched-chain amino acid aminotransferase
MSVYIFDSFISSDTGPADRIHTDAMSIYEVVKVIEGIPLFLEEHLKRLHHSASMINKSVAYDDSFIIDKLNKLIELNQIKRGRVKFVVVFHANGDHFYAVQADDIEPAHELYRTGVKIKSMKIERQNPEAKIINSNYNQAVSETMDRHNVYEVLLIKADGKVTEGSRSNIFFINGRTIYTSQSKDILTGITRAHLFEICKQNYITIVEQDILYDHLQDFDSAFITGTSPGVLPVSEIDDYSFRVENETLKEISEAYFKAVEEYIRKNH